MLQILDSVVSEYLRLNSSLAQINSRIRISIFWFAKSG